MTQALTIRLPDNVYTAMRESAFDDRKSMNTWLTDLIREHVDEYNNTTHK